MGVRDGLSVVVGIIGLILIPIGELYSQSPITAITTSDNPATLVTYNNVKGAGLRRSDNTLRSSWDSTGTDFIVKFNTGATNNIRSVIQYTVSGLASTVITAPANAIVKLRRVGNSYVNDTRIHHNFWATYSSIPASGSVSGTYNFTAPEVVLPEDAFLLNNITSGYDNIFENSINNLHASNIERLDFIIPSGLNVQVASDLTNSGVAIFDRGTGDPFKIAAITAVNAANDPTAYGPLVSVSASQFGGNLLSSSFNYCIITRDSKYQGQSRPSSPDNQNLRGVFINLQVLGLAVNQDFYGYSLFANDVSAANPDWTTYSTNTNTSSGLDPVNIMGLYKTPFSVLSVSMEFRAARKQQTALLDFTIHNTIANEHVTAERSANGRDFYPIGRIEINGVGKYQFIDPNPAPGNNFYRLQLVEKAGSSGYSEVRKVVMPEVPAVKIFPNPSTGTVHIKIPASWRNKRIALDITNTAGRVVWHQSMINTTSGEMIDLNKLPPGTYFLKLLNIDDDLQYSQNLVKIKN